MASRSSKRSKPKFKSSISGMGVPGLYTNNPVKPTYFCKHVYCDTFTLTSSTGGVFGTEQVFRLNSLFDPDFTGVGHQPYGRDTLAALYNQYKVLGTLVEVRWTDTSGDGAVGGLLIQQPADSMTLAGMAIGQAGEKPGAKLSFVSNTGEQNSYVKQYVSIQKASGLTPVQFKADTNVYSSVITTSPTLTPWLRLAVADTGGASGTILHCQVRLTFYAQWFDRITQGQS